MTRRSRGMLLAAWSLGALLAASGCASAPAPTAKTHLPKPSPIASQTPRPLAPVTAIAPLTGKAVPVGSLDYPALSAKIDNLESARPQIGLEKADIVYEELVEGGISRYVAVWHSQLPATIGPVRSIRPMDPDIISPLGGIVAYSGGRPNFVKMMRSTGVYNAIHGQSDTDSTFYRTSAREAPHNVIVKAAEMVKQHKQLAPPALQFAYSPDAASSSAALLGTATTNVSTTISPIRYPAWKWDAAKQAFLRYQEGSVDRDSNHKQLTATNVVILRVAVLWPYDIVPKTVLVDHGEAWACSAGKCVHGSWSKKSRTGRITIAADHGGSVHLAPGNTWVELVPRSGGSVTFSR